MEGTIGNPFLTRTRFQKALSSSPSPAFRVGPELGPCSWACQKTSPLFLRSKIRSSRLHMQFDTLSCKYYQVLRLEGWAASKGGCYPPSCCKTDGFGSGERAGLSSLLLNHAVSTSIVSRTSLQMSPSSSATNYHGSFQSPGDFISVWNWTAGKQRRVGKLRVDLQILDTFPGNYIDWFLPMRSRCVSLSFLMNTSMGRRTVWQTVRRTIPSQKMLQVNMLARDYCDAAGGWLVDGGWLKFIQLGL